MPEYISDYRIGKLIFELKTDINGLGKYILADINMGFYGIIRQEVYNTLGSEFIWLVHILNLDTIRWAALIREFQADKRSKHNEIITIHNHNYEILLDKDKDNYLSVSLTPIEEVSNVLTMKKNPDDDMEEMRMIFNSTQDALFLIKEDKNKYIYVRNNIPHQVLTGYDQEDIYGKTPSEILGKKLGELQEYYCKACLENKNAISFEESFEFRGEKKIILTKMTPLIKENGASYIVGSRVDITPLKEMLYKKDEMIAKFKTMFTAHTAVMLLIEPEDGKIMDANPAASEFYGYNLEELKELTIQDINILNSEEVKKRRQMALQKHQKYFVFPHRMKNGNIRYVDVYSCPIDLGGKRLLYSIIFDVTEREENKMELYREKEFLNITLKSIGDGVVTTDLRGRITSINKAAEDIVQWKNEEVTGKPFTEVFLMKSEISGEVNPDIVDYVLKTGTIQELMNHTLLFDRFGNGIPIADSVAPIINNIGEIYGAVMVFRNVSLEKEKKNKIIYLSYHDTLTELYNRRYFDNELEGIDREENYPLAVLIGDVNGLKMTNDVFGHETGDRLLKIIAQSMKQCITEQDLAVRWGGDEFVILVPNLDEERTEALIDRIKLDFTQQKINNVIEISVSFGYSLKRRKEQEIDTVLQEAEEMMYRMKMTDSKSLRSSIVNTILATLYENSSETSEHADRLGKYCMQIGKELKLRYEALTELELLSSLHDIGKVGISRDILLKPGPLDSEEWREMKRHSEIGYRIALNVPELAPVADYILYHHERWDGSGYPRGLQGSDIPLNCRILAVVDAFDAMINDRSYRKAMEKQAAIDEIIRFSGKQFDPQVVAAFIHIVGVQ